MRARSMTGGLAVVLSVAWIAGGRAAASPQTADAAPAKMSGIWKLNKDLEKPGDPSSGGDPAAGAGQGGGPGGRYGDRLGGGGRLGGFGGRERHPGDSQQMLQMRALMRDTSEAPAQLVIVATPTDVTLTDDEGHVRKFVANDKKQKLDIGTAVVDARARWDGGSFTTELSLGSLKVTTTYQVTVEGHQMVVTSQSQGGGRATPAAPAPVTHTYDKAQ